jgi:hypothetical protein
VKEEVRRGVYVSRSVRSAGMNWGFDDWNSMRPRLAVS